MTIKTSRAYYEVLFKTALYIVEKEIAFRKFKRSVDLQRRNDVKAGSTDKLNKIVCVEMIDILAEAISEMKKDYLEKSRFVSVSGDGSQAWKTDEEKQLIYGKFLVREDVGLCPCIFLLPCHMKDIGGANADATKEAFIAACAKFGDMEVLRKKITCLCAEGAAVNMGKKRGALIQLSDYCDVSRLYIIHCLNYNLELAIKDSYCKIQEFEEINEFPHILFKMMKDSGKTWDAFRMVGDRLGNVVEQGSGVDSLVTKKMYPTITGVQKKFTQCGWFAAVILFYISS